MKVRQSKRAPKANETVQMSKKNADGETVQVSKKYLERLLQMTVGTDQHSAAQNTAYTPHTAHNDITSVSQIHIPVTWPAPSGADSRLVAQQCPHSQEPRDLSWHLKEQATRREETTSKREQAIGREETTRRKQENSQRGRREELHEEYFPWGRPGGGAPIRSTSGTLLTNYSVQGRALEDIRSSNLWQLGAQWQQPSEQPATRE